MYLYQKGDYESMRKDTLEFAKEKYFSGHSDTRSVQENFDLLTSFIQDSADKHIPSKTSRSVFSTLWHFRLPLPIQMFIKVASSPTLSGIGMPSPIL